MQEDNVVEHQHALTINVVEHHHALTINVLGHHHALTINVVEHHHALTINVVEHFLRCVIPVVLSNNKNKLLVHMYVVKNTTILFGVACDEAEIHSLTLIYIYIFTHCPLLLQVALSIGWN